MISYSISNHTFDRMGTRFAPLIDPDHFLGRSAFDIPRHKEPAVNMKATVNEFLLEVATPGFAKEDIVVEVKGDILTVKGEKSKTENIDNQDFIVYEFDTDKFERQFKLASEINPENIAAKYENGILKLNFHHLDSNAIGGGKQIVIR